MTKDDPLMSREQVAQYLQVSPKTVDRLQMPKVRIGPRMVRWRRSVVEAFVDGTPTEVAA